MSTLVAIKNFPFLFFFTVGLSVIEMASHAEVGTTTGPPLRSLEGLWEYASSEEVGENGQLEITTDSWRVAWGDGDLVATHRQYESGTSLFLVDYRFDDTYHNFVYDYGKDETGQSYAIDSHDLAAWQLYIVRDETLLVMSDETNVPVLCLRVSDGRLQFAPVELWLGVYERKLSVVKRAIASGYPVDELPPRFFQNLLILSTDAPLESIKNSKP